MWGFLATSCAIFWARTGRRRPPPAGVLTDEGHREGLVWAGCSGRGREPRRAVPRRAPGPGVLGGPRSHPAAPDGMVSGCSAPTHFGGPGGTTPANLTLTPTCPPFRRRRSARLRWGWVWARNVSGRSCNTQQRPPPQPLSASEDLVERGAHGGASYRIRHVHYAQCYSIHSAGPVTGCDGINTGRGAVEGPVVCRGLSAAP